MLMFNTAVQSGNVVLWLQYLKLEFHEEIQHQLVFDVQICLSDAEIIYTFGF